MSSKKKPDRIDRLAAVVEELVKLVAMQAAAQSAPVVRADSSPGRIARYSVPDLVALLGAKEMTWTEWQTAAVVGQGMSPRTFERLATVARHAGLVTVRREHNSFYRRADHA